MVQVMFISYKLRYCGQVSGQHFTPSPPCALCFGVQHLSTSADVQTVKKHSSNEVEKIICEDKDNDHQVIKSKHKKNIFHALLGLPPFYLQVLLHIEEKLFTYVHQAVFREDNGRAVSVQSL